MKLKKILLFLFMLMLLPVAVHAENGVVIQNLTPPIGNFAPNLTPVAQTELTLFTGNSKTITVNVSPNAFESKIAWRMGTSPSDTRLLTFQDAGTGEKKTYQSEGIVVSLNNSQGTSVTIQCNAKTTKPVYLYYGVRESNLMYTYKLIKITGYQKINDFKIPENLTISVNAAGKTDNDYALSITELSPKLELLSNPVLTWTSDNSDIVTVIESEGYHHTVTLHGIKTGDAIITAAPADGYGESRSCQVHVVEPTQSITVTGPDSVYTGHDFTLTTSIQNAFASILDSGYKKDRLIWTITDVNGKEVDSSLLAVKSTKLNGQTEETIFHSTGIDSTTATTMQVTITATAGIRQN